MGQLGQPVLQISIDIYSKLDWLVVSTRLKNNSQIGSCLQVGVKIKKYLKQPSSRGVWSNFLKQQKMEGKNFINIYLYGKTTHVVIRHIP